MFGEGHIIMDDPSITADDSDKEKAVKWFNEILIARKRRNRGKTVIIRNRVNW